MFTIFLYILKVFFFTCLWEHTESDLFRASKELSRAFGASTPCKLAAVVQVTEEQSNPNTSLLSEKGCVPCVLKREGKRRVSWDYATETPHSEKIKVC